MQNSFGEILGFVERMVENLNVDENNDQVSLVQYSQKPSVEFYLNTYKTSQDVADNVQAVTHKGGKPLNTGAALEYVKNNIFSASSGSRRLQGVPQILVLVTGGRSSDDVRNAVEDLKEIGVTTIVVGTMKADTLEIQTISLDPSLAFFAADSNDLSNIEQQITTAFRTYKTAAINQASYGKIMLI